MVVDMLQDNVYSGKHYRMDQAAQGIIAPIQKLIAWGRNNGHKIVYANDSFLDGDFIFQGRVEAHCLRDTAGSQVIDDLKPQAGDLVLPKRRFSAFYKTDLDDTLRTWGVEEILVCGISTPICVLLTATDSVAHGFRAVVVTECCAAHRPEVHQSVIDLYSNTALFPLLRFASLEEVLSGSEEK